MDQREKYRDEIIWMVNQLKDEDSLRQIYTIVLKYMLKRGSSH